MAQIRGHPHFSHADAVAVEHIIMHFATREQFRQYMPELFAYAQQPHGTALGTSVVMFGHTAPLSGSS
jgi:hypothetical protein